MDLEQNGKAVFDEEPRDNSIDGMVGQEHIYHADEMDVEVDDGDMTYRVEKLNLVTASLHEDEQILKETLKVREKEVLKVYEKLSERKKYLLELITKDYNQNALSLDISLQEQFQELRKVIDEQNKTIDHLRTEISKQGLSSGNIDQSSIKIKMKTDEFVEEIKVGRKFSSTQYVRDYLERPQAYKVAYEDVKYEYELRLKIKESLEAEKALYEKKKEQISLLKKREREIEQQLQKERDSLN